MRTPKPKLMQVTLAERGFAYLPIINAINSIKDAKAFFIGGYVRDLVRHALNQTRHIDDGDIDVEVYGLETSQLMSVLSRFGRCEIEGKDFPVIHFYSDLGEAQFAIPRTEKPTGQGGHTDVLVNADPFMYPWLAVLRRDYTCNALLLDVNGVVYDYVNGIEDIRNRLLRHTSVQFIDDPLRVLRGMRFAGRFCYKMAPETVALCRTMIGQFYRLSADRLWKEWRRWALESVKPSYGLDILDETGWLYAFPELASQRWVIQQPEHHPEVYLWTHLKAVIDRAADQREIFETEHDKLSLMFGALLHDTAKPECTVIDEDGVIRSARHAEEGRKHVMPFFVRIMPNADDIKHPGPFKFLIESVENLVGEHMFPYYVITRPGIRRVARRIYPATLKLLTTLVWCDINGRPDPKDPDAIYDPPKLFEVLNFAINDKIDDTKPDDIIMGRHLIELGLKSGVHFSKILAAARDAQYEGAFIDVDGGMQWLRNNLQIILLKENEKGGVI